MNRAAVALLFATALGWTPGASDDVLTVTVTNVNNAINGNVADFFALQANPGFDGISFAEAIEAANGTSGAKRIFFAPHLIGQSIRLTPSDHQYFILGSGDLTIDGDIDADGAPDVTLDATDSQFGTPLTIRSSNNAILGLRFVNFLGVSIHFACMDRACTPRTIENVAIIGNDIRSTRGSGIELGVWGRLQGSEAEHLHDFVYRGITVKGNTFDVIDAGVGIRPGVGGARRNRAVDIAITDNQIKAYVAVDVGACDTDTPDLHSDDSVVENLAIQRNVIDTAGIHIYAANHGNQNCSVRNVLISHNTLRAPAYLGIYMGAGISGMRYRATSHNSLTNVTIRDNVIEDSLGCAIEIGAGDLFLLESAALAHDDNRVANVVIERNRLIRYKKCGIQVWGGIANPGSLPLSSSRNVFDGLAIERNLFEAASEFPDPVAISLVAGRSSGSSTAEDNVVQGVSIRSNTIRNNRVGVSLVGGRGGAAARNTLRVTSLASNTFEENVVDLEVQQNADGASGNDIVLPRRRSARH